MLKSAKIGFKLAYVAIVSLVPSIASAQQFNDVASQLEAADHRASLHQVTTSTRVQISYRMPLAIGQPGDFDAQAASTTKSHQALYDLASHECEHLRTLSPGACRLVSLVLDDRGPQYGQAVSAQVTAVAIFEIITPLSGAAENAPELPSKNLK